jgi:hypothetical protein
MMGCFVNCGKKTLILISLLLADCAVNAQTADWRAGLFSFFDNVEFGRSAFKIPQTMAGVMLVPEGGITWDTIHRINIGVDMMHEFGSSKAIDKFYATAYYLYDSKPFRFIMGAFPRNMALEKYPRLFFQDSISYYRPNMNGIFAEYRHENDYFNMWLDWTGRQSHTVHEAFFLGLSGRLNAGIFFIRHFGYYFHYASKMDPIVDEALHDNGLLLTSAGIDLSDKFFPGRLEASAGWVAGLERARADNTGWISKNGLMLEARAEYKFIGLYNTFYTGSGLMQFYNDHGNDLYWGDPVYRATTSDRADIYLDIIRKNRTNLELTYSLHFLEGRIYNEQMLKLKVNLEGKSKKQSQ